MRPNQQYILVALGAIGLADSQLVSINDIVPRHLRRRLDQGKKHYSLWTQEVSNGDINGAMQISQGTNPGFEPKQQVPSLWANDAETPNLTNTLKRPIPSLWATDPVGVVPPTTRNELPRPPSGESVTDTQSKLASGAQLHDGVDLKVKPEPQTQNDLPRLASRDSDTDAQPQLASDAHLPNGVNVIAKAQAQARNDLAQFLAGDLGTDVQPKVVSDVLLSKWVDWKAKAQAQNTPNVGASNEKNPASSPNRRKFVSYKSSDWEKFWLENVEDLQDDRKICKILLEDQLKNIRDYLELLCTAKLMEPFQQWCVIDDGHAQLWFNTANKDKLELTFERPVHLLFHIPPPETVLPGPHHEHILSKLTFLDEVTGQTYHEYIEPLVGHLRFPLQKCMHPSPVTPQYKNSYISFRGWIIPPPPVVRGDKALLIDADATSWESKRGGITPQFIVDTWYRHGLEMDHVSVFSKDTSSVEFFEDVPADMVAKTSFQQCTLAGKLQSNSKDTPYLPLFINNLATENDYVILKLDLSNLSGRYNYLAYLDSMENRVDELIWEHKSESMFLADKLLDTDLTLRQSYDIVLMMRQRGIRAHVWI